MKNYINIVILAILFMFFVFSEPVVLANGNSEMDDIILSGINFVSAGRDDKHNYVNQENLKSASDSIYHTFFIVGFILTTIIGVVLGIQFIVSGVEGQVKVKEALIPYVIGCVVIFGAFGIWKISISIFKGIDENIDAKQTVEGTQSIIDQAIHSTQKVKSK